MDPYYPITLRLAGKKIIVVGGGKVAERKIKGLIGTKADITVVSPEVSTKINKLAAAGEVNWLAKTFAIEDIKGAFMIFAATNDRDLNQAIKIAAEAHQLVTIADDPEGSNFQVPAKVQRGRLTIAVSTGGASPTLARNIKAQLEQEFDDRYDDYLEFLFQARQQIVQEVADPSLKRKLLKAIASPAFFTSKSRQTDLLALYKNLTQN
ncbi:bifunctional precorrin-2 dehydrogenase/sirohydrochlorin ferrochelatase [Bacillus sp. EB600]|uniref:precorrin-2 dehydrogenase/sirohydrochlorin ferrochelatase family protein n=1 Tax=Bacillus sp. EB600 TaxID=2806345 RepID=UPI00210B7B06|nr:NAD(P)-dependent oxidoreductase [Bacillus sp. EB600]MCQ6280519.1 siroheme synthase [Bacillus sp. EB600]